jgi:NADH-quinone oxidoreductase subunit F
MATRKTATAEERAARIEKALRRAYRPHAVRAASEVPHIVLCAGTACTASGGATLRAAVEEALAARGLTAKVPVVETGCHGFCAEGPLVVLRPQGIPYTRVRPHDVATIIETTLVGNGVVEGLLYKDPLTGTGVANERDLPFYAGQVRRVLANLGRVEPTCIDDYLARDGYAALASVLTADDPEAVIATVEASGLRGRGGGGFPTGRKWRLCRENPGEAHYVVCNGDEGDPGAFLDRSLLEGDPHAVLEGVLIAAFAVGAEQAWVYTRREYGPAVERLQSALTQARARDLLGRNILKSGFDCDVRVFAAAGAYVCGESTALVNVIEGRRGMPRGHHVRLVEKGLYGQPTVVNNVETLASIPWLIRHGSEEFAAVGSDAAKGTKVLSLTGAVRTTGLVEVPQGTSLRQIVVGLGGGVAEGRQLRAVQPGGQSGGILPANELDVRYDYESLRETGAAMCTGGVVVVDDTSCVVDLTTLAMRFMTAESCGKCVPCRIGTRRTLEILERICAGEGEPEDIDRLERLCDDIAEGSLCELGIGATRPVRTALHYFRDEFEAHIREQRCPAKVCRPLIRYGISKAECTGCHACYVACPVDAISGERKKLHKIDQRLCIKCDTCRQVCNFDAVRVDTGILTTRGAAAGRRPALAGRRST